MYDFTVVSQNSRIAALEVIGQNMYLDISIFSFLR